MRKRMMEKLRKISTMYYLRQIVACLLVYCMFFNPAIALAAPPPSNPVQVAGDTIAGYSGLGTDITNVLMGDSSRAVINWDSLDTLSIQELHFLKDTGNFAVLNRVIAGGATQFNGSLLGNQGDIFIVNTRGIIFGPDSYIQARNFVASGIDIRNSDFMNSFYQFEKFTLPEGEGHPFSNQIGDVTNEGIGVGINHGINAENVALIGQNVTNIGIIRTTATGGAVIMAAGESVYLSEIGSNVVVQLTMADPAQHTVDNTGTIEATSGNVGKVVLAAGDIFSTAISGVESLAATAHRNIELNTGNGDFNADNMTLTADFDGSGEGNVDINTGVNINGGTFTSGGVDFDNTGGVITTNGGKADIQNTGVVTIGAAINAGTGDVDIDGGDPGVATSITGGGTITSSGTITLEASGSIGGLGAAINTASTGTIDASSTSGDIYIDNTGAVALGTVSTAGSDIVINNTGELTINSLEAGGDGDVYLTTTAGDVIVNDVKALDDQITINSAGAILENGNDAAADLTAATLLLTANTGITGQSPIETSATDITASTDAGNIDIDNTNGSATTASLAVTTGAGTILFSQAGDGPLDVTSATTADGSIGIDVENAALTAQMVTAGGGDVDDNVSLTTTTSGDVIVDDITAAGNTITIDSAGAITEDGSDPAVDLTADELDLDAETGIYALSPIETKATSIAADTTGGNIDISNENTEDTTATSLTTGTGNIDFYQHGEGSLQVDLATTESGYIDVEVADGGNLTAISVEAGGNGDVYLTTTAGVGGDYNGNGNGDSDVFVDDVKALDDTITIDSAGAINETADDTTVDITGSDLILTAQYEIGGSPTPGKTNDTLGAIETDVTSLDVHSNISGDIVIVETDDVDLYDIIATSGSIYLEATLGGMTHVMPVEGTSTIEAGSSTLTLVQQNDLDLAGFNFDNQAFTDLMMESYNGSITAVDADNGGNDENAADQWQSIQAIAKDNIELQGSDSVEDIKIGTHPGFDPDPSKHTFDGLVESTDGGVSIISDNRTVRTAGDTILDEVDISGKSDDEMDIGVDLPYGPGKVAIVIMGAEDLMLGPDTALTASGTYDTTGAVDDREGVDFLDVPASIPSGFPRYEGDPFDAAIYLASTGGDVDVSGPVSIESYNMILNGRPNGNDYNGGYYEYIPQGTMVIDAFDTVTFDLTFDDSVNPSPFEESLANGEVGDRLEVASRITEWLFQAAGRLPYPSYPYYGGGPFPSDYTYVLRGAGLDNPAIAAIAAITDDRSRAWVLVDPTNAPLDREAGENAEKQALGLDGCPVLLAAASAELGIPGETIEVSLANAYALNTDIQPCESCARLVNAAAILRDEDGSRMAAANQVFNALAPADAPFTPEVAASIVTAFAGRINDGTQYATAIEYIDAFVRYIAVLSTEMGSPVGDSLAFVMDKYGAGVLGSDNSSIAAFIATRLETGETFGD